MAIDNTSYLGNDSWGNSTTTILNASETYTGLWNNVSNYGAINLTVFSDKDSFSNGLEFQWSGDGINIDRIEGSNVKANTGRAFSFCPRAKYFRVNYINGPISQTIFRLTVTYRNQGNGLIARPLNQSLTYDNLAQSVRSAASAEDSDNIGVFQFLRSKNNRLLVDASALVQPIAPTPPF